MLLKVFIFVCVIGRKSKIVNLCETDTVSKHWSSGPCVLMLADSAARLSEGAVCVRAGGQVD